MKHKFDERKFFEDLMELPKFVCTSRDIAAYFGRPHSIIVRKIEQSIDDILEKRSDLKWLMRFLFCKARFVTRGRKYPIYILTRSSLYFMTNRLRRMKKFYKFWSIYQLTMIETRCKLKLGMKVEDIPFALLTKIVERR